MRFNIVKQSDVSFGTALHYALNWSYGRKALCGKEMRTIARDFEVGSKRVCGNCARIMAKNVETAHAEALAMTTPAMTTPATIAVPKPAVKLSTAMTSGLIHFARTGNWDNVRPATMCALLDRALVGHSRKGINPDLVTDLGRAVLTELGETVAAEPPVLRIVDTRTGRVRRILGTSLTTNAPHTTIVWVQREGEQRAYAWSADELMSKWHDLVAIDENGRTNEHPTYRVTCAPTSDHPAARSWTVTAPTAGAAQERVCAENNLTWSHVHAGLVSTALVDPAAWNPHMIQGIAIEGVNSSARAEVLGTFVHGFSGVGVMVRYEDYDQPVFLSENVLRGCPDYVAI